MDSRRSISRCPSIRTTWAVKQGSYQGAQLFVRKRSGLEKAVGHTDYPFQIGVAVPLNNPSGDGLPQGTELQELNEIEDRLGPALSRVGAVLTVILTTSKMREFVCYAQTWKPQDFEALVKQIESEIGSHQLQFMMRRDPDWAAYKSF